MLAGEVASCSLVPHCRGQLLWSCSHLSWDRDERMRAACKELGKCDSWWFKGKGGWFIFIHSFIQRKKLTVSASEHFLPAVAVSTEFVSSVCFVFFSCYFTVPTLANSVTKALTVGSGYPSLLFRPGLIQAHWHHGLFATASAAAGFGLWHTCPPRTSLKKNGSRVLSEASSRTSWPLLYLHIVKIN